MQHEQGVVEIIQNYTTWPYADQREISLGELKKVILQKDPGDGYWCNRQQRHLARDDECRLAASVDVGNTSQQISVKLYRWHR